MQEYRCAEPELSLHLFEMEPWRLLNPGRGLAQLVNGRHKGHIATAQHHVLLCMHQDACQCQATATAACKCATVPSQLKTNQTCQPLPATSDFFLIFLKVRPHLIICCPAAVSLFQV